MANTEKVRELQSKVMRDIAAGAIIPIMMIGDDLDLFEKLYKLGPCSSENFSKRIDLDHRYIREWLLALSAAGYITYDIDTEFFSMSDEQYSVLGDENSSSLMIGGFENLVGAVHNYEIIKQNFKTGEGTEWGSLHPCCLSGSARFFKPAYSIFLLNKWLPSIKGAIETLKNGGSFADIGCGFGHSTTMIAEAFPESLVTGIDPHEQSIIEAQKIAKKKNLENLFYEISSAVSYTGEYDIISFFDCLHDMGDPLAAVSYAKTKLKAGGILMIIEPFANDEVSQNFNLIGQMYYSFSTIACIPASKSQDVGMALGAQAGLGKLTSILNQGGFSKVEMTYKTASNMVIEARI